jgi:HK97 family phage major capsid protein
MNLIEEVKASVEGIGGSIADMRKQHETEVAALRERLELLESKGMSPGPQGGAGRAADPAGVRYLKTQSGALLPYLTKSAQFADLPDAKQDSEPFSIGEYARAALMGSKESKIASGTALVPTAVGARIVDMVRAQTTVIRAGAGTIRIDGPTNLARLTGDPTIHVHTEGSTDISESDVTATPVSLNPKLLAALVPLTVELVQDSPNLDALLNASIAAAFAAKLDALALAAIVADAGVPKSASAHDPATWTGTNAAIAAALAANQDVPKAHISTAANYAARSVILASTAGSWLGKPPYLAGMAELFTSAMTADQAIFGDFEAGVAMAIRADLTLEVVRHAKATSGSHLLVAHMRAAPVILQPARLFWQKKVP